ncbi:MAG: molecular chaperone DnaJ [bacterium]
MEDHYQILGVERTATAQEIKRAYRRLAHQYHPDKDGGDEAKFKKINAAYQILSDENKRSQYDQFGQGFDGAGGFGGAGSPHINVNFEDLGDIGSIFDQFFGGRSSRGTRQQQGDDIGVDTTISFIESAHGLKKELTHRLYQTCPRCHGNQAEPGTPINNCTICRGTGTTSTTRQTMLGVFSQRSVCSACQGEGKKIVTPCTECRGEGRTLSNRTLIVNIPPGIADGQTIRIAGQGAAGRGGAPGDLYVTVHVKPHAALRRDGDNVRSSIEIPFTEAALGTTVKIETLEDKKKLNIPAGTQPGTEFTINSLGFPRLDSTNRGDHIVTANITIPKRLTRHQHKLLTEFKQTRRRKFF